MAKDRRAAVGPEARDEGPPDVGFRYAKLIGNMKADTRLAFIADGLPIFLDSARSLMAAANALREYPREADILEGHAKEECAKMLILVDIVRCPPKIVSSRVGVMLRWFYDHLARLIYAKAQTWKPTSLAELQEYVDGERRSHHVDGDYAEYIMPNSEVFWREASLYADVMKHEDAEPTWHSPLKGMGRVGTWDPPAFSLVNALSALGALTPKGLHAMRDAWGGVEFKGDVSWDAAEEPCKVMLKSLFDNGLVSEGATKGDVNLVRGNWQMPMYHLDFAKITVPLAELKRQQTALQPRE